MPGDVSAFTNQDPERSLFYDEILRCGEYTLRYETVEFEDSSWDNTHRKMMDFSNYHLLLGISVGMELSPLKSVWNHNGVVDDGTNPINPRTHRVVYPWEAVRYTNSVLFAAVKSVEYISQGVTVEKISGTTWWKNNEVSGHVGELEDPDTGTSDNLNLRSHWANNYMDLMAPVMFDTRMDRPTRAFNLVQNPKVEIALTTNPRAYAINVDADWAEPPAEAPATEGDMTCAEITGYHIDEKALDAYNDDDGIYIWVVFHLATLTKMEVPRLLTNPYQQLRLTTTETIDWVDADREFYSFLVKPRFREVVWGLRSTAFVDFPTWRGRPFMKGGEIFYPSEQTREMKEPYHGGYQWFNFSGFHFGGESFYEVEARINAVTILKDIAIVFRIALKNYHKKRTNHFLYIWSESINPDSLQPAGAANNTVELKLTFYNDMFPYIAELFIWTSYDNVLEITPNTITYAIPT